MLATTVQAFSVHQNTPGKTRLAAKTSEVLPPIAPTTVSVVGRQSVMLQATSSGGKKKRRRRRKQSPAAGSNAAESSSSSPPPTPKAAAEKPSPVEAPKAVEKVSVEVDVVEALDADDDEEVDIAVLKDVASFSFDGPIEGVEGEGTTTIPTPQAGISESGEAVPSPEAQDGAIPLPDIKDTLRRKEVEAQMARMEEEQEAKQKKIDRKDRQALLKVRLWAEKNDCEIVLSCSKSSPIFSFSLI